MVNQQQNSEDLISTSTTTAAVERRVLPRPKYDPGPKHKSGFVKLIQIAGMIWSVHVRWWKVCVPLGLLISAALGAATWYFIVPKYRSDATVRVLEEAPHIAYPDSSRSKKFLSTQLQTFRMRTVLRAALKDIYPQVPAATEKSDAYDWLSTNLQVRVVAGSEFIRASFTDQDPAAAKAIVESIVQAYMDYNRQHTKDFDVAVIQVLLDEKARREITLRRLRDEVRRLSKEAGPLEQVDDSLTSPLASIHDLLIQTEVDWELAKANLEAARNQAPIASVTDVEVERAMTAHPDLVEMLREQMLLADQLEGMEKRLVAPASSTRYQALKQRHDELNDSVTKFRDRFQTEAKQAILADATLQQQRLLEQLGEDVRQKDVIRNYLLKRLDREKGNRSESNEDTVELEFARADLDRQQAVFDLINKRIVQLQTEQFAPARVILVDEPIVPLKPDNSPWLMIICAAAIGLVVPLAVVLCMETVAQRVTDARILEEQDLEVFGEIAKLPDFLPTGQDGPTPGRSLTLFEESVDQLCNSIRLSPELQEAQILAIVSAMSGEGKTHVSTQLAISLATSTKEPVLLMETDFRSPDIARMLGINKDAGLLDFFTGKVESLDDVIAHVNPHLDVIHAGTRTRNLHSVLHERDIRDLMSDLRSRYRYVVIDTPPILSAGEALLFASQSDATLICARRGYSRMSQILQVRERLLRAQSNPIGVVLNGVPRRSYLYSYGEYAFK